MPELVWMLWGRDPCWESVIHWL